MTVVLDAGALIAIDRRDRRVGAMLRVLQQQRTPVRTSTGTVAQVWRDGARQVNLARLLTGVSSVSLGLDAAKRAGELLGRSRTRDVCDSHLALLVAAGDTVVTSDPDDLRALLGVRRVKASVVAV